MKAWLQLGTTLFRWPWLWGWCTALLLVLPLSLVWLEAPNRWLFRAGLQLNTKPEPASPLVKITVSQRELDRLANDAPGALALGDLLQGLRGVYTRGVVVLLDEVPHPDNYAIDLLSKGFAEPQAAAGDVPALPLLAELQAGVQRQQVFLSGVQDGAVVLGVRSAGGKQENPEAKISYLRESQRVLPSANKAAANPLWELLQKQDRGLFNSEILPLAGFRFETSMQGYAYFDGQSLAYPLLWRVHDAVFPDLVLESLRRLRGATRIQQQGQAVLLDDKVLPLSAGAVIYPFYSAASGKPAPVESLSLADLQTTRDYQRFHNRLVLIGAKDSPALENVSAALYSLDKGAYYRVPAWYALAEKAALLVLLAYVLLLLPRVSIKTGLAATGVLLLGLLVLQLILQVGSKQWLPTALPMLYLVAGHLLWLLSRLLNSWFGEWQVVVLAKGEAPPVQARVRSEPRLPGPERAADRSTFDKTMALTRPDGKLRFGRYEVDRELGRGAMGVVYLGHDPSIDRKVAIKTLNYAQFTPEELGEVKERFLREAKAVGKFDSHPHIISIFDTGEDSERAYVVMEYVEGKALSQYTQKNALIKDYDELYYIIECVADALNYAHGKGVIHRDIKPSNILYDANNSKVKVSDFGIARIINSSATRTGEIMGSPLYMSPEQVKGEKLTGKTDIYSLGVTFYQLLTGDLPFKGDTIPAITHQIVQGKYTPVTEFNSRIPTSAQRIIARAMHKDPERRYGDAAEMMEEIGRIRAREFPR